MLDAGYSVLQASYRHKDWHFSLSWSNPQVRNFMTAETELLNCHLYKLYRGYSRDAGNSLSLNLSWRVSRGRRHQAVEKTIHLKDTDNGIIKP